VAGTGEGAQMSLPQYRAYPDAGVEEAAISQGGIGIMIVGGIVGETGIDVCLPRDVIRLRIEEEGEGGVEIVIGVVQEEGGGLSHGRGRGRRLGGRDTTKIFCFCFLTKITYVVALGLLIHIPP
jgi:hypothetical protein